MHNSSGIDSHPIVIGYDGSASAGAAIAEAARLFPGRRALIVSAWRSIAPAVPASLVAVPADIAREAQATLDAGSEADAGALGDEGVALAVDAGLDAEALPVASSVPAWRTLVEAAEDQDAAVVVVGSRGCSTLRAAVLGSVSTGVLHHCRRPVLVVRPEDKG